MLSATAVLRAGARRAVSRSSGAAATTTRSNITTAYAFSLSSKGLATAARTGSPSSRISAGAPDRTREIVAQTISNIGSRREGQQYLKLFASVSSQKFAVVKIGGQLLRDNLEELCQSFALLFELGLYPVIVHGAGPQLNQLLEDAGVEPQFEEGIRITDAKTLGIARKLFLEENRKLVMRLDELGVATRSLDGIFQADYLDKEKWQYVGKVTKVNTDSIKQSINAGYIPVLTSMAESEDGHLLNINADVAASELARALEPLKIVYLSEKGGLFDGEGQMISQINLDQEFAGLMEKPWVRYGTRLKIKEINELLGSLPRTSSVAIIHPSDLQRELFTDSGAGTLIRRGAAIKRVTSVSEFEDLDKLKENLIRDQEGLKATIDQSIDYLKGSPFTAYYDDTMQCLAVVIPPGPNRSIATLLTLAITKSGWLTNTAENIFTAIKKDYPSFVWTVSEHDENLTWFFEKADGSFNRNGSVLFYQSPDPSLADILPVYEDFVSHGQADAERKV
ncbi:Protein arg-6, mitochondrial [Fusarium torreyae]|uniref:acetylglutamate kinase n=1 Tax=Fusarium torreyae TaxID=1237075 RepID=A0A9W8SFC4_9HYPO|nr:Protein arg-6, mitochondrial [Fusarium torreyae]